MANNPSINVTFNFEYDGTTPTVAIDLRHGPVLYQTGTGAAVLHPLFSMSPTGASHVTITGSGGSLGAASVPTTATVNNNVMMVQIPTGIPAGTLAVSASVKY